MYYYEIDASEDDYFNVEHVAVRFKPGEGEYDLEVNSGYRNDILDSTLIKEGEITYLLGYGDDTVYGGDVEDIVYADLEEVPGSYWDEGKAWTGADKLYLGGGNDRAYGGAGNDMIDGGRGADVLHGEAGDDVIKGGWNDGEQDYLAGGRGDDVYWDAESGNTDYATPYDYIVEEKDEGHDTVMVQLGTASFKLGDNIEDLIVYDWESADTVKQGTKLIGNELDNHLVGGRYADTLYGGAGNDLLEGGQSGDTMYGGLNDDTYVVSSAADKIVEYTLQGNDTVKSQLTDYTLTDNVETLRLSRYGDANGAGNGLGNYIYGNDFVNVIEGLAGDDKLFGDGGNDRLWGGTGGDFINGNEGSDFLYGEDGMDSLVGETGVDFMWGGAGSDWLWGGEDGDFLNGDAGDDKLYGDGGGDTLNGGDGDDRLEGGGGNDTLHGNGMTDTLSGGDGDDKLTGGAGADKLTGGAGKDKFAYTNKTDSNVGSGIDKILDFLKGEDKIDLSKMDAKTTVYGNDAFSWKGMSQPTAKSAGSLWGQHFDANAYEGEKVRIYGDMNGDGTADFMFDVMGVASLTSTDFFL